MLITRNNPRVLATRAPATQYFIAGAAASIPFVLTLALFLAARRAMGAMSAPLAPLPLIATAIGLLAWVLFLRATLRGPNQMIPGGPANTLGPLSWVTLSTSASLLLVAFACSFPGTQFVDWLVWVPTLAAAWVRPSALAQLGRTFANRSPSTPLPIRDSAESTDLVLQRVTRYRSEDGSISLHGEMQAEFAAGERDATLFVAFCPPFDRLPKVEAHIADDIVADVKLTQVLHNGAQLDVRLPRPATEPTSIGLELIAVEPQAS
jgi:hypothetical protein